MKCSPWFDKRLRKGQRFGFLLLPAGALFALALINCLTMALVSPAIAAPAEGTGKGQEGSYSVCRIEGGPFEIRRKYKSMEGPFVSYTFRIGNIVAAKHVEIPAARVKYVENGNAASMAPVTAAADAAVAADPGGARPLSANGAVVVGEGMVLPPGVKNARDAKRELYWFKGVKVEVLDENDKVLPSAEFICHLNLDIDRDFRNKVFTEGEPCNVFRIVSLTQGQTDVRFPKGYAVPAASDEKWTVTMQAANRTTDKYRKIKHRCTLLFVKDSDLVTPVKALSWHIPAGVVVVDRDTENRSSADQHHSCMSTTLGLHANTQNAAPVETDALGRRITGHWLVPRGKSIYNRAVADSIGPTFAEKERRIHFVWTHVHPCCTSASLVDCDHALKRDIFRVKAKTKTKPGLEILRIKTISSKKGIVMPAGRSYGMTAKYNNTTSGAVDSMVSFGIFSEDNTFARPKWCFSSPGDELFCGTKTEMTSGTRPQCDQVESALMLAISKGYEDIARRMIEEKSDLRRVNGSGDDALHLAAVKSSPELVELLLSNGAEINSANSAGQTPLLLSISNKNFPVSLALIKKGADVNKHDSEGTTPLIMSTFLNNTEVSLALLGAGASCEPVNKFGDSAAKLAQLNKNSNILTALDARRDNR